MKNMSINKIILDDFRNNHDFGNLELLVPKLDAISENTTLMARSFQRTSNRNRRCGAKPKTDMNCCWPGEVCGIGEGDCDFDVDCADGLKCGHDNCYYDFRTSDIRENWDVMADCCYCN